ncbi:MAG: PD40 domain-containing protein [Acidobacteria bacterium]|nr:PD40 domain-containing protein [Acidobacteriota bacterium]
MSHNQGATIRRPHPAALPTALLAVLWIPLLHVLSLAGMAGESTFGGRGGTWHYYCSSSQSLPTMYFSKAFDVTSPPGTPNVDPMKMANAFQKFIAGKYGYKGPLVACFGAYKDLAEVQAAERQRISDLRVAKKWTLIETGWVYRWPEAGANVSEPTAASNSAQAAGVADTQNVAAGPTGDAEAAPAPAQSSADQISQNQAPQNQTQQSPGTDLAGTEVFVRMAELVDSSQGGMGRQYRGVVTKSANGGNGAAVPNGTVAMLTLTRNQAGWAAQLNTLLIKGQMVSVSSGPATVAGGVQSAATNAVNTVTSIFGSFGHKSNNAASAAQAAISGQRIFLPPGTQLRFVLNGVSASSGAFTPGAATSAAGLHPTNGPGAVSTPLPGGALHAKIQETRLGPSMQAGMFVISPDGGHYAAFAMHGSREVIVVDGTDGPEFDHAAHAYSVGAIDVSFSADGRRSAYIAQSGDELVVVVDNKSRGVIVSNRGAIVPAIDSSHNYPPYQGILVPGHQVLISPSGAHFACIGHPSANVMNMYLDGVKGPDLESIDLKQVAFVNDHLVYAAVTPDQVSHLVVDNKIGPAYASLTSLRVSDDGKHYAFIAATKGGWMVVVDGVPGTPRAFAGNGLHDMILSPNGRVAFVGDVHLGGRVENITQALFVDDREISREIKPFATRDRWDVYRSSIYAVFSPDGKRFAYSKTVPGGVAAVIDGTVGRAYDGLGVIKFSPDSRHAYFVGVRGQNFVVVDGREMPGINRLDNFVFSNEGGRFAYEAYAADGFHVVVDGKDSSKFYNIIPHSLNFSPDSKHYVYAGCTNYLKCQLVQDGNVTNVPGLSEFPTRTFRPSYIFPPVFFSPDSARIAYAYPRADGTSGNVWFINGQEITHGSSFEFPAFSPNSKHFVAFSWNGKAYALIANGKAGPAYEDIPETNLNVARFEEAHLYRFLGVKEGAVYRVTVDLGE